jgi:glycosidase
VCGGGCDWNPPEGLSCWFKPYLPDFNFKRDDARSWSVGNAIDWVTRTGIDGYRLDAVKHLETQWVIDLRARLRSEIESQTGNTFYLVGETFDGDRGLIGSYVEPNTKLDGQFDFPLRAKLARVILRRDGSMSELSDFLASNDTFYAPGSVMGTFLGNHDLPRAIHLAEDSPLWGEWDGGRERAWSNQPQLPSQRSAFERLAVAYAFLFTTRGLPLIYYGDEWGMAGAGDPDNRRFMQWSGHNPNQSYLRDRIARLAAIRTEHPALRRGVRTTLGTSNDAFVYEMNGDGERLIIALNRGDSSTAAPSLPAGSYTDLITEQSVTSPLTLPARSAMILQPQ